MNNKTVFTNNPIITFRLNALEELLMQISSRLDEIEEKINALKIDESDTTSSSDTTIVHLHDVDNDSI